MLAFFIPIVFWDLGINSLEIKTYIARILVAIGLVFFLYDYLKQPHKIAIPSHSTTYTSLLTLLYITFKLIYSEYQETLIWMDLVLSILLFFVFYSYLKEPDFFDRLIFIISASSSIVSCYYLLQKLGLDPIFWYNPDGTPSGSTFANRNLMVFNLLLSTPYCLFLATSEKLNRKYYGKLFLAINVIAILFSNSRVSLGIIAITTPIYIFYCSSLGLFTNRTKKTFFSLLLTFGGLGFVAFSFWISKLSKPELIMLTHARTQVWSDAWKMVLSSPWFGNGPGSFINIFPKFRSGELGYYFPLNHQIDHSHNEYLEIMLDYGIVGFLLFTIFFISVLGFRIDKIFLKNQNNRVLIFALMSVINGLFFSFFGEASRTLFCTYTFFISLSIFAYYKRPYTHNIQSSIAFRIAIALVLLFFTLFTIKYSTQSLMSNIYTKRSIIASKDQPNFDLAFKSINRAITINPKNSYAYFQRAHLYMTIDSVKLAYSDYQTTQTIRPFTPLLHYNLGIVLLKLGDTSSAINEFGLESGLHPTFQPLIYNLVSVLYQKQRYQMSLDFCNQLLSINPQHEYGIKMHELLLSHLK